MARGRKKESGKRRDSKGRILPTGITQRKDGRYMWRCTYNGITYHPVYSWDLKWLKNYAEEERVKIAKGIHIDPSSMTLNEYFYRWMETYQKDKLKPQSYQNNLDYWGWYIRDYIGKKKLQKITSEDLILHYRWLQEREIKPISWNTVIRINSIVNGAFEKAVQKEVIMKNPAFKIVEDIPKKRVHEKRTALSVEQQRAFMEYVSGHEYYKFHKNLFVYLFGTGCRVGEACALCFQDLNFEDEYIDINKTLYYRKEGDEQKRRKSIGGTKTEHSTRTIPMLPEVKESLENQKLYQSSVKQKCAEDVQVVHGVKDVVKLKDSYKDFVFLNQSGTPYTPEYITQIVHKIIDSYNKDEQSNAEKEHRKPVLMGHFSAHYARHTFATRCMEYGISEEHVGLWLGHEKSGNRTTNGYIHVENWKCLKEDVEKLKDMKLA
jgi:integrase